MSQHEASTETIGESNYEMYMLPPIESHNLLMDVAKMVGPALGDAVGAMFGGGDQKDAMEREVTPDLFRSALTRLFEDINKDTLERVIRTFSRVTHVDGKPLEKIFERHFQGALDEMYRWLAWGMRVQWGKSLSALAKGAAGQGALSVLMGGRSQSPSTSTGSDGG